MEIENEEVESIRFRARYRFQTQGEKCSKFFLSLEKRNYNNKTMFSVITDEGEHCTEQKRILQEQKKFYENLYTIDESVQFSLTNEWDIKLTEEQKLKLDRDISLEELHEALSGMKRNKVPGLTGLTVEFYLEFWDKIGPMLLKMYEACYECKLLNATARQGLMSLIPKKGKDSRKIKNLRPLTLLSTDYKILVRAMALRMKTVLPHIISDCQMGFMEGRNIAANLRQTVDLITHVNATGKRAIIVSIDFEKCFDRVSHNSMFKALELFGFRNRFISWIRLFFTQFQVCTQNAGYLLELFNKTRGCNQGCPISPFCYLVCGEIMAQLIINNPNIKGITMNNVEFIISQFADDTGLYLEYDECTLQACVNTLTMVEENLGLKVSYDKTCIYRIGSLKNSDAKLYTTKEFRWSDDDIKMLGVMISNNAEQSSAGYDPTIDKMEGIMNQWYHRNTTLMGKAIVINSLLMSMFVYKMCVLPPPTSIQVERVEKIILKYLWTGKKPKIPLKILELDKKDGGLKVSNILYRYKSLQLRWVTMIGDYPQIQNYAYSWLNDTLGPLIWECNLNKEHAETACKGNSYWKGVLEDWCELHYHDPENEDEIRNQVIWYNSHIKTVQELFNINKETERYFRNGLVKLNDILHEDNVFLPYHIIKDIYGCSWMWCTRLKSAIPKKWLSKMNMHDDIDTTSENGQNNNKRIYVTF